MPSVASDIRINLLANLGAFIAPLKQAGDETEKAAQRFNRAFDSIKASAERAQKEQFAWAHAMGTEGQFAAGTQTAGDPGRSREMRIADQLPFGKSLRTSISKEAAETAALLGKETGSLKGLLGSVAGELGAASGLGGMLGTLGSLATGPLGIASAAIGGAMAIHGEGMAWAGERRQRASLARATAVELGSGIEDASRLNAVGIDAEAGGRLERAIAGKSQGLTDLGLDANKLRAEPIKDAMLEVAAAMDRIHDPVTRAKAAVDIFGKAGVELLPTLDHLKDKMAALGKDEIVTAEQAAKAKRADQAKKEADRQYGEAKGAAFRAIGFGEDSGMQRDRRSAMFWATLTGNRGETAAKFQAQDEAVAHAAENDEIQQKAAAAAAKLAVEHEKTAAAAKLAAERLATFTDNTRALSERLDSGGFAAAYGNHGGEVAQYMRDYDAGKVGGTIGVSRDSQAAQDAGKVYGELLKQIDRIAEARKRDPLTRQENSANFRYFEAIKGNEAYLAQRYGAQGAGIDTDPEIIHRRAQMNLRAEKDYAGGLGIKDPQQEYADRLSELLDAQGHVSQDKLRRAAVAAADNLTAALDTPFETAFEKFESHMTEINRRQREGVYSADEAKRRKDAEIETELAHAGIKRPIEEFKKSFQELADLRERGTISFAEYDHRRRELEKAARVGAVAAASGESVSPVAAMAIGSREAYSQMARAISGTDKQDLQKAANAKLDEIKRAIQANKPPPDRVLR